MLLSQMELSLLNLIGSIGRTPLSFLTWRGRILAALSVFAHQKWSLHRTWWSSQLSTCPSLFPKVLRCPSFLHGSKTNLNKQTETNKQDKTCFCNSIHHQTSWKTKPSSLPSFHLPTSHSLFSPLHSGSASSSPPKPFPDGQQPPLIAKPNSQCSVPVLWPCWPILHSWTSFPWFL